MSTYFTDAEELTRRYRIADPGRRTPPRPPTRTRTRTRIAGTLRRAAHRLDG